MHERNCPRCGFHLNSYNYYFCSNCGQKLDDVLVRPFITAKVTHYQAPKGVFQQKAQKIIRKAGHLLSLPHVKRDIFLGTVAFLLTVNVVSMLFLYVEPFKSLFPFNKKSTSAETTEQVSANLLKLHINSMPSVFGTQELASYAPKDSALYIETTSYSYFVDNILIRESPFKEQFLASKELVQDNAALFSVKNGELWEAGVIFTPKEADFTVNMLDVVRNEKVIVEVVDGKIIVATNQMVIDKVKEVRSKTALSLFQVPAFATSNNKLEREGVVKVILSDKEVLVTKDLIKSYSPGLGSLIDPIISSGLKELVII